MLLSNYYEPYGKNIFGQTLYIKLKNPIPNYPSAQEIKEGSEKLVKDAITQITTKKL